MRKVISILVLTLSLTLPILGQVLNRAEYFFDTDPGTGNGISVTITAGASINANFSMNINALSNDFHTLNFRVRDSNGKWSHFQTRSFFIVTPSVVIPPSINVTKAEYFFDSDPGTGNGTNVPVIAAPSINQNTAIPINSLALGFHSLNFRVRDDKGRWSHFATRTFYVVPSVIVPVAVSITKAEYFFDNDPGVGLGVNVPVIPAGQISSNLVIPTTSLVPGFHNLNFRVRDDKGRWSHFATRTFYFVPPATGVLSTSLRKAEYFFDTDPGPGNATAVPIPSGSPQNNSFALNISSLAAGFHVVGIRYQDDLGRWSHFAVRTFYIISSNSLPATNVKKIEYYIDSDPGIGLATNFTFTPAPSIDQLFAIDLSGVASGSHKLFVRAKDDQGFWSSTLSADFTILACTPPPAPTAPGLSRCDVGAVTLLATGAIGSEVYHWYEDATTTTVLFIGASFTTPSLAATTTYYVAVFDPNTLCESTRTSVTAGIISTSAPVLNVTGSVTICQGNSITLSAPAGFTDYLWSTGATTQQIIVNTAGNYTAVVGNGMCQSTASLPANINMAARPAKPTIAATGVLCAGQTVTLSGPPGFTSYAWSNGATAQQTVVTQVGSYTLMVGDVNGCNSIPSDPIVLNGPPAKPAIFVVGNTTLCGGQTATLLGPTGLASYLWSSGATTQQLTASAAGNYTLQVTDLSGCVSPLSDPITVTVNPSPAKPIITASDSTSFCVGKSVTLSGPGGFGYVWSTGATSQDISINQTGSFTLIVRDNNGCTSVASDPLVVTVTPCTTSHPPVIQDKIIIVPVEGKLTTSLVDLLSDPDDDLDFASLMIVRPLASGAKAAIDADGNLTVDYTSTLFAGDENLTLEVCDLAKNCTRKDFVIRVVGEVVVYNAISPNGDGLNEALFLEYVDVLEEAKNNRVRIFNRWGDVVYDAENYNNNTIAFKGIGTNGDALPSGTYFYRIDFKSGIPYKTGFISLRK